MIQARNVFPSGIDQVNISGERNTNSTTYQDLTGTYTIPADGMYFISAYFSTTSAAGTKFILRGRILKNSNVISPSIEMTSTQNYATNNFCTGTTSAAFYGHSGDVIKIQTAMNNWTGKSAHNCYIQRIY